MPIRAAFRRYSVIHSLKLAIPGYFTIGVCI